MPETQCPIPQSSCSDTRKIAYGIICPLSHLREQYLSDVPRVQDDYNVLTRGLRKKKINNQGNYMLALNDPHDLQLSYKGKQT